MGGYIINNNAQENGCVTGGGTTVSGSIVIANNTAGEAGSQIESNVYLTRTGNVNYDKMTVGELTEGADIGISLESSHDPNIDTVFSNGGADYIKYFTSDNSDYVIVPDGENLKMLKKSKCDHSASINKPTCTDTAICSVCNGTIDMLIHTYDEYGYDSIQHWNKCSACGGEEIGSKEKHNGGTATCTSKAKCDVCLQYYGDIAADNHELSYSDNGNVITEVCSKGCGHSATAEIKQDFTDNVYDGIAKKAKVKYSDNWIGEKTAELKYYLNDEIPGNSVSECVNVGDYVVTLTVGGKTAKLLFRIEKAELLVTPNPSSITYGEEPVGNGVIIEGFVNGENENVLRGELSYAFDYSRYDDVGEYEFTPYGYESDNYEFDYRKGTLKVVAANQSAPTTPIAVNTTYIDTADGKIAGVDSTMEYRKEGETNYTAVTGTEITNLAVGTYYVRYAANANYNASPDKEINISSDGKREVAIAEDPTSSRVIIGGKLSDSVLTGGIARDADAVMILGTYTWKDGTEVLDTKGTFQKTVIFTPDNSAYKSVEFDVDVTVVICDTASGEHEFTVPQNDSEDHWNKCSGCDTTDTKIKHSGSDDGDCTTEVKCSCGYVITNATAGHTGGTATCTAKAKCEVCGEEYSEANGHGQIEIKTAKPASCDEEGYTGDEHCNICGEKLKEGTVVAKTAHAYKNGKCTVCGATDPNYVLPDNPKTDDDGVMHLWFFMAVSALGISAITFGKKRKVF